MVITGTNKAARIADHLQRSFPFTVDKFRLTGPENMRTPHFGLFRSDNMGSVGCAVRQSYRPHTVDDVTALAMAAAEAFHGDCEVECHWREGHIVSIAPSIEYRQSIFGTDTIWPRLLISARYDGNAFRGTLATRS